jgi:hypothetical protein
VFLALARPRIPNLPLGDVAEHYPSIRGLLRESTRGRQNLIISRISKTPKGINGVQIGPGPGYRIPFAMAASHEVKSGGTGGGSGI